MNHRAEYTRITLTADAARELRADHRPHSYYLAQGLMSVPRWDTELWNLAAFGQTFWRAPQTAPTSEDEGPIRPAPPRRPRRPGRPRRR